MSYGVNRASKIAMPVDTAGLGGSLRESLDLLSQRLGRITTHDLARHASQSRIIDAS
jgi:hypothetical protein